LLSTEVLTLLCGLTPISQSWSWSKDPVLRPFFEVLVKAVLVLALDGLKVLKNCCLKTKKVLRPFSRPKRS